MSQYLRCLKTSVLVNERRI